MEESRGNHLCSNKEAKLRASAFLNDIVNIDFVCGLMFLKNIMPQTKTLSDYLQRKSVNVANVVNVASALVVLNSTQDCLKRMRSEDKNFNNQIEAAISVAKYLGTISQILQDSTKTDVVQKQRISSCNKLAPSTEQSSLSKLTAFLLLLLKRKSVSEVPLNPSLKY